MSKRTNGSGSLAERKPPSSVKERKFAKNSHSVSDKGKGLNQEKRVKANESTKMLKKKEGYEMGFGSRMGKS
ncbi:hypothetical protein LPTSP4_34260 [Leptospira ryugenii]|uniref:Uncharacterized protein n=1 Tax=Leptospira ryugenii TaxID=1917863 RepID=A0A2P2E4T4_9LEPT|nr:hypothetical protein LPTSP4_34260 [Leptospira ryugenii]